MTKRGALGTVEGMALWVVAGWLALAWPAWAARPACEQGQGLALQAVLPGVVVVHGLWPATASMDPASVRPDRMATTVVLGQGRTLTVVDPGPTQRVGHALQTILQCRQRARVTALVNTHAHAEQVLANSAFVAPVMALSGTAQAMRKRCPQCLASLQDDLGAQAMQGTRIVLPQQILREGQSLPIGGRRWWVREMRQAHTENDLVLWSPERENLASAHPKGGVVLVGGLVDGRWPVLAQGSVLGWLQALDQLQAMQPDWLIGQHVVAGPHQVQPALQRQRDYLCGVLGHAWRRLEQGQSEAEGVQDLALPVHWPSPEAGAEKAWQRQHLFNQRRAWREAEQLWLEHQAWPLACGSAPDVGR